VINVDTQPRHDTSVLNVEKCRVRSLNAPFKGVIACLREAASAKAGEIMPVFEANLTPAGYSSLS
jgi:hypothetical protein